MGENGKLNDRQAAFVAYYIQSKNATRSAQRAGYSGDLSALAVTGSDLLRNAKVRGEIDRVIRARLPSKEDVLDLVAARATMDVTPYLDRETGMLDVQALSDAGLGHLVKGVKPGREGLEIALVDPQAATKTLARYHRLLGADTQVDVNTTLTADADALASLAQQIAAIQQEPVQQDDTGDSTA